jgi:hypothetical protein
LAGPGRAKTALTARLFCARSQKPVDITGNFYAACPAADSEKPLCQHSLTSNTLIAKLISQSR